LVGQPKIDYLARVDQICVQRQAEIAASGPNELTVDRMITWVHADHQALVAMKAPSGAEDLRHEIVALDAGLVDAVDQAVARAAVQPDREAALQRELAGLSAREQQVGTRYAELGLHACAGRPA
jgi:hypothetical protein